MVKDGAPVLASRTGEVVKIVDDNNKWGPSKKFRPHLNYITLQHIQDGTIEYSQYCHLAKDSVKNFGLEVGSIVNVGDQIGVVGKTGWTDRDHLHIIIFRPPLVTDPQEIREIGFKSLIPQWNIEETINQ